MIDLIYVTNVCQSHLLNVSSRSYSKQNFNFSEIERQDTKMWSYVVLKIVRASYICMNGLTQLVSGYSLSSGNSQERRNMIECYERSAHVIKIKMKRRKFELEGPELSHFVLRQEQEHETNKKTQYVATNAA